MMRARSIAAATFWSLIAALPAVAQSTGPADGGVQRDDQPRQVEPSVPPAREPRALPGRRPAPPAKTEDADAPSPAGCRYRDNKLDLIV